MRRVLMLGVVLAGAAGLAAMALVRAPLPALEVASVNHSVAGGAGLCPWREPARDMSAFFPGADSYRTDILILSHVRREILARLGPGATIESNALYVYRIAEHVRVRGTVAVCRAAGEYGALEIVVALDSSRRIVGLRIQRQREPEATSRALTSAAWSSAFLGKTATSHLAPGEDLPAVPAVARRSADSMAAAVRAVLVELDAAERAGVVHLHEESH